MHIAAQNRYNKRSYKKQVFTWKTISFLHEHLLFYLLFTGGINSGSQVFITDPTINPIVIYNNPVRYIVNRRKTAQELYHNLPKEGSYCLTTLLYPAHRKQLLQEIRERLKDGLPCRVISTSLIEAGVDVDFPAVYREEAGLDSILQAAGRCNREGKRPAEQSLVQIFTLEGQRVPRMLEQNVSATQSVLKKYADPASLEAIETYFLFYRTLKGDKRLDEQQILQGFEQDMEGRIFPFATAAERFHLIETPAVTVYIPKGEGEYLLARLRAGEMSKTLFRKLGQYGVPVYPDHLKTLEEAGAVCQISEGVCSALTEKANRSVQCSALPLQRSCILPFYKMFPVRRHRQCGTFL